MEFNFNLSLLNNDTSISPNQADEEAATAASLQQDLIEDSKSKSEKAAEAIDSIEKQKQLLNWNSMFSLGNLNTNGTSNESEIVTPDKLSNMWYEASYFSKNKKEEEFVRNSIARYKELNGLAKQIEKPAELTDSSTNISIEETANKLKNSVSGWDVPASVGFNAASDAIQGIATAGWGFAYYAPKAAYSMLDAVFTAPINWAYEKISGNDGKLITPLSQQYQESWGELTGTDGSFTQVFDTAFGDAISITANPYGGISDAAGKMLADVATIGGAIRTTNILMGIKPGFYGTEKAWQATKEAGILAKIGKVPTKELCKEMAISLPSAIGQGVTRSLTGELAYIGANFDGEYGTSWATYTDMYESSPKLNYSLLLGGTFFDAYSTMRAASNTINKFITKGAEVRKEFTKIDIKNTFGSGEKFANYTNPTVNSVLAIKDIKESNNIIKFAMADKVQQGLLKVETYNDAVKELDKLVDVAKEQLTVNVGKLYKEAVPNTAEYNMIVKAATNTPDLVRAADKIESFKTAADAFEKLKANKGTLLRTTWNKVKSAITRAKNLEKSTDAEIIRDYYVINANGDVISADRYQPSIADSINPKRLKQDKGGLFYYDSTIGGQGRQITLTNTPTYDTAERYAYLAEKNADVLLKDSDKKSIQSVVAKMEEMAQTNPYVAQTMAGLLDRHPEFGNKFITFSKSQYQKLADKQIRNILDKKISLKAQDAELIKTANKLGLTIIDNDKFLANLAKDNSSIRGAEFGAIENAIYTAPTKPEKALLLTVNNQKLDNILGQHRLGDIVKVQELARQKSLIKIGRENPLLNNISETFLNNPIINEARNIDAFGDKFLPQSVRIFFQRHFGFGSNSVLQATRRLAEFTQNATYEYLGKRLSGVREASKQLTSADKIQLNKFKKLVNMGFEITDDFKLATKEVPIGAKDVAVLDDIGNPKLGVEEEFEEVLTTKNQMALKRAEELGLIENADDIIEGVVTSLPDLSNALGEELELNSAVKNLLNEYNSVNREIYSGRQEIANVMGANKSYIQNFHMPSPSGKHVNFIVDGNNQVVSTVTGATPAQLKDATKLEEKLLYEYGVRGSKYKVLTIDDMERLHKEGLMNSDEWHGWEDIQGDAANLKYESGNTARTLTGASFVYDDKILENLYDGLIKQGRKLGQEYQSAFFDKERQYAARLLDSTSDPEMKNLYNEYISLIGGENRTTGIMQSVNQSISNITDKLRIFEPAVSIRDYLTNKRVKAILEDSGELATMDAFIAKLPKASGSNITVKLQSATNWAMLRFAKASYGLLNILSLIPMSNLAIGFLQKGKFETAAQQATRIGWYGTTASIEKSIKQVDWFGAMRSTLPSMFNGRAKRILTQAKKFGYLNDMDMVLHEMVYQPHLTINNPEASRMRQLIGKTADKINKAGTAFGDWTERISRQFSYTMGYNIAEKMGTASEHVKHMFAKQFSDNIVGNYSAIAKAGIFRGAIPSLLGLFKTYTMNVMQVLADTYAHGGMKALMKPLAAQSIVFGTKSLPMADALEDFVFPIDGKEDGYQKLVDFCGGNENWARAIYYGPLSTALNTDFTTRGEINPISGGFLPLSGNFRNWTMKDINPFFQMVSDTADLAAGFVNEMGSSLPFSDQRLSELISMYSPISSIRGFARLNTYQLDADGNRVFYRTDRAGKIQSTNALASVLGMNSVGEQREFDVSKRIAQRDLIDQQRMDAVRQSARGMFRAIKGGRLEIDADIIKNLYNDYIMARGNPNTFGQWLSTNISIATTPTVWNKIDILSRSKDPNAFYDIQRLLSAASWEDK